jgi:hypothetical protein
MSALGWVCFLGTLLPAVLAMWWGGFLSGRRYESGIWEHWLANEEEVQESTKAKRGVRLRVMKVRR